MTPRVEIWSMDGKTFLGTLPAPNPGVQYFQRPSTSNTVSGTDPKIQPVAFSASWRRLDDWTIRRIFITDATLTLLSGIKGFVAANEALPDEKLLEYAVKNARRVALGYTRIAAVADLFAVNMTFARQLCDRFGVDPDEDGCR